MTARKKSGKRAAKSWELSTVDSGDMRVVRRLLLVIAEDLENTARDVMPIGGEWEFLSSLGQLRDLAHAIREGRLSAFVADSLPALDAREAPLDLDKLAKLAEQGRRGQCSGCRCPAPPVGETCACCASNAIPDPEPFV